MVCKYFGGKRWFFQDDNAPVHRSLPTRQWKTENYIPSISWPAQSPDINVIENTWKAVKRHVQQNISSIETRQDLIAYVLKRWRVMPSAVRLDFAKNPLCDNQQTDSLEVRFYFCLYIFLRESNSHIQFNVARDRHVMTHFWLPSVYY